MYKNKNNEGCGVTRGKAISKAKGDYYAFIDADDYVGYDFIKTMLDVCLRTNSEISICGTINRNFEYKYKNEDHIIEEYICSKKQLYFDYMTESWIKQYNGNKLYHKRVIKKHKYCKLRFCEDSFTTFK